MNFQKGDVVRLKSGGPDMTVSYTEVKDGVTLVFCVWFTGKQAKGRSFADYLLESVHAKA